MASSMHLGGCRDLTSLRHYRCLSYSNPSYMYIRFWAWHTVYTSVNRMLSRESRIGHLIRWLLVFLLGLLLNFSSLLAFLQFHRSLLLPSRCFQVLFSPRSFHSNCLFLINIPARGLFTSLICPRIFRQTYHLPTRFLIRVGVFSVMISRAIRFDRKTLCFSPDYSLGIDPGLFPLHPFFWYPTHFSI